MRVMRFKRIFSALLCVIVCRSIGPTDAYGVIVPFNLKNVAIYSSTPPSTITATTGAQIPGGFDNSAAGNEFNTSSLQFDIDGDFDPMGADPTIYFDFQIRTASFVGGQLVFDGFQHVFTPAPSGSYVITKGDNSYLNLPFAQGDVIGDGVDEFIRNGFGPPGPPNNNTFDVAIDEGGKTTQFLPGVDNFVGFQLGSGDFGWIRVQYDNTIPGTLMFLDGAYDNTGAPIVAGGTSAALTGDYNGNHVVDAADYVLWRKTPANYGGDPSGYNAWRANFGKTGGAGSVLMSAVPEPSGICLAAMAVGSLLVGKRRRQSA